MEPPLPLLPPSEEEEQESSTTIVNFTAGTGQRDGNLFFFSKANQEQLQIIPAKNFPQEIRLNQRITGAAPPTIVSPSLSSWAPPVFHLLDGDADDDNKNHPCLHAAREPFEWIQRLINPGTRRRVDGVKEDQEVSSLIPCGCVFCSVSLGNPPVGDMFGTGSTLFGYSATRLRSL